LSIKIWPEGGISFHCWSGCSREQVIQALGLSDLFPPRAQGRPWARPTAARPPESPSGLPLVEAAALVDAAAQCLWAVEGTGALGYLRRRGLTDQTIRSARLGWAPEVAVPRRDGSEPWHTSGIIIPWRTRERLTRVEVRQADGRYPEVFRDRPGLYPGPEVIRPGEPLILAEGALDCLLLAQELGELASVVTLGSVSATRPDPPILGPLLAASPWLIATDADHGGDNAAKRWLETSSRRVRPPLKDWGETYAVGVDLRRWWEDRLPLERFLARLQARGIRLDGRLVHPRIGVAPCTGRITYSDPPLQQLPKSDRPARLGPVVDGRAFVRADFGQIEPRILHAILHQRGLIDWEPGEDLYLTLGGDQADREALKTAVNALINGGAPPPGARGKVAEFIEARDIYCGPLARQAMADGFIRTLGDRLIRLDADEENHSGKTVNYVVQGTAADIFLKGVLALAAALEVEGSPAAVAFLLHDELWVETGPEVLARVAALVRREMEGAALALGVEVPVRLDDASQVAWEIAEERAAIAEFDGGLSREEAERRVGLR
jgi:hypothetical protein